jgi:SAM-dependent methyltransferase
LFEAIYYLNSPDRFLNESRRVLKDDGVLLICTVNRNWTDFNPSPFSQRYLFGEELVANLRENNFEVELFGAFPATNDAKLDKVTSALKRTAINLNLMPRTMKGKELLKRIFFGQLHEIPSELSDGLVGYDDIHPIPSDADNSGFKIIYAIGYAR